MPSLTVSLKAIEKMRQREGWVPPLIMTYHEQNIEFFRAIPNHGVMYLSTVIYLPHILRCGAAGSFKPDVQIKMRPSASVDIVEVASLQAARLA